MIRFVLCTTEWIRLIDVEVILGLVELVRMVRICCILQILWLVLKVVRMRWASPVWCNRSGDGMVCR